MRSLISWQWGKSFVPQSVQARNDSYVKILSVSLSYPEKFPDFSKHRKCDIVLITGDGHCLAQDVKTFNSWAIPHDIYAVNRSLVFHERQVDHWAAVDIEETAWFTQHISGKIEPDKFILRHTLGEEVKWGDVDSLGLFDVYWKMDYKFENDYQRRTFVGNTGYFAMLTAIKMGYKKIVLAGIPIDFGPHFYDPPEMDGPQWGGMTFAQWMDFKMFVPEADKVRSMSRYSAFILGTATKEWALNGS